MSFSRLLSLLVLVASANIASSFVAPSAGSSTSSLQATRYLENGVNSRYGSSRDYYNDSSSSYYNNYGSTYDRQRDEHRNRMYSPRNDVYQRQTEVVNGQPGYNNNYYSSNSYNNYRRSLVNPRNDVYSPQVDYYGSPYQVDYAADSMVDRELAKIRAKGRYAIENELINTYRVNVPHDLTNEELACYLLKYRLASQGSYANNGYRQRGNWYSENQRFRPNTMGYSDNNNNSYSSRGNTAGSWVENSSNNYWRN